MSKNIFQELHGYLKKNSLRPAERGVEDSRPQDSGQQDVYTPTDDGFNAAALDLSPRPVESIEEDPVPETVEVPQTQNVDNEAAVNDAAAAAVAEKEQIQHQRESLIRECTDLMNDLDRFAGQGDEGANQMVEFVLSRLEDALDRNQVTRIEGESQFNNIRHRTEAGKRVPQGTPILETVRPGYILDNRVIRRALVKVDADQKPA